ILARRLAPGAPGVSPAPARFAAPLREVCQDLALQLLADAGGASHDIRIDVTGANTEAAALAVARAVARSNLVKAAIFGNDPNWGRIIAQVGTVPAAIAPFDPERVDVTINGVQVCRDSTAYDDPATLDLAADRAVTILIDLKAGPASATLYTNDLTHAYVEENSAYST
ncbi:MAG: bifunctional ornithine acetyltransferase/N-acetylglutamate synthase, partial [Promicromonosporaceae bacterium]|nr:bifunctional ornithine acetyltransferase/N-acetylglutamate synthase [Promicromonosporaceae bacterium]